MSSILDSIKRSARSGGIKAELFMLDREIKQRQGSFGIELFDYLEPLATNPNFFSADDRLTQVLRPALLETQREIAVVYQKKTKLKERMKQAEIKRAAAFPKKAETFQERLQNVAKSTVLAGGETAQKTEMMIYENTLKRHKQVFGQRFYVVLEDLEDREAWLPTDRYVRSFYDTARKDIEMTRKKAKAKMEELEALGFSRKEIQNELDKANAETNQQDTSYVAPSAMSPVFTSTTTNSPSPAVVPSETNASFPTNPSYFPSSDTPSLSFTTPAPAPVAPPPPLLTPTIANLNTPATTTYSGGIGPIGGGGPIGGNQVVSTEEDGFVMGGAPGMGTRSPPGYASSWSGGQPNNTASSYHDDPFAVFSSTATPAPAAAPTTTQQTSSQQKGKFPDSNLFLY